MPDSGDDKEDVVALLSEDVGVVSSPLGEKALARVVGAAAKHPRFKSISIGGTPSLRAGRRYEASWSGPRSAERCAKTPTPHVLEVLHEEGLAWATPV